VETSKLTTGARTARRLREQQVWALAILYSLVLAAALYLRSWGLGAESIWYDEAISIAQSSGTLENLITRASQDNYPPLHNLLIHPLLRIFGNSEALVRLPSLLFSMIAIIATAGLTSTLGRPRAGLFAAVVLTFSSFQIYYAQEARMYALLAGCTALCSWSMASYLTRPGLGRGLLVTLSAGATLYSHFFGMLNVFALGIASLIVAIFMRARLPRGAALCFVWLGLGGILFTPWVAFVITRVSSVTKAGFWIPYPEPSFLWAQLNTMLDGPVGIAISITGLALAIFVGVQRRPTRDPEAGSNDAILVVVSLSLLAIPFLIALAASLFATPVIFHRYLIGSLPALAVMVGVGFDFLIRLFKTPFRIPLTVLFTGALAGALLFAAYPRLYPHKENWRAVASYISQRWSQDDCIAVADITLLAPLRFYLGQIDCGLGLVAQADEVSTITGQLFLPAVGWTQGATQEGIESLEKSGFSLTDRFATEQVELKVFSRRESAELGSLSIEIAFRAELYQGPPHFQVFADKTLIGEGDITATRSTAPHVLALKSEQDPAAIRIWFTNDLFEGFERDRNLIVVSITINGRVIDLSKLPRRPNSIVWLEGEIEVASGEAPLEVLRPEEGW
jgi:mannosyltransferase